MALNYTPPVKMIHTLWIHRIGGTDFLVRGPHDKLVTLAEVVVGEHGYYNADGQFECASLSLQTAIYEDGFEPHPHLYNAIAYLERNDAYMMLMTGDEPETYFKDLKLKFDNEYVKYPYEFIWPENFKMVKREAPYDFTRKMLSAEEINSNLRDYNLEGHLHSVTDDEPYNQYDSDDICSFCKNPMHSCPEDGDHSCEMREILRRLRRNRHKEPMTRKR